jgi:hypothetical protein
LPSDTKWICLFAYNNGGELLGVYPLIILRKLGIAGIYIQFFRIPHYKNHTVRADGLIKPGSENVIKIFIEFLKRRFKAFPTIKIERIPLISPTLRYLENSSSKHFYYKKLITYEDYVNTHGEYDEFLQSLNSKFRRELKRQERRLTENAKLFFKLDEKRKE